MWFHSSPTRWLKNYIDSVSVPDPSRSFGEKPVERTSVAPTVCQSLLGAANYHGDEPRIHIYRVEVHSPVKPEPELNIWDQKHTDEHIITQEVLDAHGGKIDMQYLGFVRWTKDMRLCIMHAILDSGDRFTGQEEMATLWDTDEEEWRPKFTAPGRIEELIAGHRQLQVSYYKHPVQPACIEPK